MFFGNSRIRFFFKLAGSIVNNMEESIQKRNTINIVNCLKCKDNFHII